MIADPCPVCGYESSHLVTLDDGSQYCPVAKVPVPDTEQRSHADVGHYVEDPDVFDEPEHDDDADEIATETVPDASESTALHATDSEPHTVSVAPDESGLRVEAVRVIAGLVLAYAVRATPGEGEILVPETGWAPPPVDSVPEMESGAVLAVAMLIDRWDIPRDDVRELAAALADLPPMEDNET